MSRTLIKLCMIGGGVIALLLGISSASAQVQEVRIGILSYRPLEQSRAQWQATADHLNAVISGYHFSIESQFFPALDKAVDQQRYDFILTNPEHYVTLRADHGLAVIATLMPLAQGRPVSSFGGVIFTRADRNDIVTLRDLRGKVISSAAEQSFGAYLIERWTMYKQDIQIGEVGRVRFTGMPQDNAVYEVLAGDADAGFVRTGILENMANENRLNLNQIKVINRQLGSDFPLLLSTELYPEWAFSATPRVSDELVKAVSLALLNIKPDDAAARVGHYFGFSPPGNYAPVEAVMMRLKLNPDRAAEFDWRDVRRKYEVPLFSGTLALLLLLLGVALYLMRANRRLKISYEKSAQLDQALKHANVSLEEKVELRTQQLRDNEQLLMDILQASPIAVRIAVDGGQKVLFANHSYEQLLGVSSGKALGVDPKLFYAHEEDYLEVLGKLSAGERIKDVQIELTIPGRGTRWTLATYVMFEFGGESAVLAWFYDITPLKLAEQALQSSEQRFRQMFENHSSAMLMIDAEDGSIVHANQAAASFYGYSIAQMSTMNIAQINTQSAEQVAEERALALHQTRNFFIFQHRLADGQSRTVEVHSSPMQVDGRTLLFSIVHDITERKYLEGLMQELAFYDQLTTLPNRRLLLDRLRMALATCARTRRYGALMFLDLDNFKSLNDLHGHEVGDQMLIEVAHRIVDCIREQDSAARFGGDEFVVMIEDLSDELSEAVTQAEIVAEKIRANLALPYVLLREGEPVTHRCSSSIGVTVFRDHDETVEQLLKWTDMAMYKAKDAGRNVIRFFDPEMQSAIETRAALEADLHQAVAEGQLRLHFQVQVDARRKPTGAEALVRWQHPQRGLVSPMQFIPLAEETGMILPIGTWVLEYACSQLRRWSEMEGFSDLTLSVNVSAKQFSQNDFVDQVSTVISKFGIKPWLLKLELTESLVLYDVEDTIVKMHALKELGLSFSMDDFGTGYSSLSYLKRLPLDQLKIDQSFVRNLATDNADMVMVMTIVDLGMNFEVDVIAEGVETELQMRLLHRSGCGHFQGYLYSKPVDLEHFEALIVSLR